MRGGRSRRMATEGVAKGGQRGRRGHFLQCTPSDSDGAQPGWPSRTFSPMHAVG
jgi:hypothetical protein